MVSVFKARSTWAAIGIILGLLGYPQFAPVADAIGKAISAPPTSVKVQSGYVIPKNQDIVVLTSYEMARLGRS